jgi:hypothetical protein
MFSCSLFPEMLYLENNTEPLVICLQRNGSHIVLDHGLPNLFFIYFCNQASFDFKHSSVKVF